MSNESSLVLQANDISIVFGGLRAVSNFSCELKKGELVGLIGPNGAGKTTVFNMLSGVYKPTEGQINFWDKEDKVHSIGKKSPAKLNQIGIARTFQNIRSDPTIIIFHVATENFFLIARSLSSCSER